MPEHSIQLRNMVLSACPKGVNDPNPFFQDLKVDLLEEIKLEPRILANYESVLIENGLKDLFEQYNTSKNESQIVDEICRKMEQGEEGGKAQRHNSSVISAVVLYLAD
mmetsp:Transcript_11999/g.18536  ORF Transcript_11999/g.18536 Transcript_11999/m.18536 type:complete len:108 (-) Transcript_11999:547-870(-)